jgi:transglutaminase-like putative cysteine protease
VAGALAGDSGSPSQLSRPGTPSGRTRVGGYLGFAGSLNTALRGNLGNKVVMMVRAQRPSYWVGETFDTWNGESWSAPKSDTHAIYQQSPFFLSVPAGSGSSGQEDLQTFYVVDSTANLVFHAQSAAELWFPSSKIYDSADGTIVSPIGLGKNAIYSVDSEISTPTAKELRTAQGGTQLPATVEASDLQLPHAYPRVEALAKKITAHDTTNYVRVQSLIAWMGTHTHYSTNIPPLPAGADTVDEFLFGNRTGFCEQISTALAVMLRSLDIPTRETVGYVPGPYDPITDLYQVRADDAHAWVQVWFPGYGWQSFDPTAVVPLASPAPGTVALDDIGRALKRVPLAPVLLGLLGLGLVASLAHWRRRRPQTWPEQMARRAERAGRRAGRPRRPHETLGEYATTLDDLTGDGSAAWRQLAASAEASAYGGQDPSPEDQRQMITRARRLRVGHHRDPDRDPDPDRDLHPVA